MRMSLSPSEVEFLGEREVVGIVPNFNLEKMYMISGDVGPFKAGLPVQVPLWLALNLRQRMRCRILCPDWMDVTVLETIKQDEIQTETFRKMPSEHYMVLAKLLFENCPGDLPNSDQLKTLIKVNYVEQEDLSHSNPSSDSPIIPRFFVPTGYLGHTDVETENLHLYFLGLWERLRNAGSSHSAGNHFHTPVLPSRIGTDFSCEEGKNYYYPLQFHSKWGRR